MNRFPDPRPRRAGLWACLALLLVAACGPPSAARYGDQPRQALTAWVSVRTAADGRLEPVVEAEVPRRVLIGQRQDDGAFMATLEVSVTALREGRQVGGGVVTTSVRLPAADDPRRDAPVKLQVPLRLRGDQPLSLLVTARQPGTIRRWQQTLGLSPATLAAAPLVIVGARLLSDEPPLLPAAAPLTLEVGCLRPARAADWPAAGCPCGPRSPGRREAVAGPRRQRLEERLPAPGDTSTVRVTWSPGGPAVRAGCGPEPGLAEHGGDELRLPRDPALSVLNLHVPVLDDGAWRQHVAWLDGLVDEERRAQLLAVPASGRAAAWRELWRGLAAAEGVEPEAGLRRHLERIVDADERYGGFGRGALSDRGRVFIRCGEPDRIETNWPTPAGSPARSGRSGPIPRPACGSSSTMPMAWATSGFGASPSRGLTEHPPESPGRCRRPICDGPFFAGDRMHVLLDFYPLGLDLPRRRQPWLSVTLMASDGGAFVWSRWWPTAVLAGAALGPGVLRRQPRALDGGHGRCSCTPTGCTWRATWSTWWSSCRPSRSVWGGWACCCWSWPPGVGGNLATAWPPGRTGWGRAALGILGASGAISGLLGYALVRVPHARVDGGLLGASRRCRDRTGPGRTSLPLPVAVLLWLLLQVVNAAARRRERQHGLLPGPPRGLRRGAVHGAHAGWRGEGRVRSESARGPRHLARR